MLVIVLRFMITIHCEWLTINAPLRVSLSESWWSEICFDGVNIVCVLVVFHRFFVFVSAFIWGRRCSREHSHVEFCQWFLKWGFFVFCWACDRRASSYWALHTSRSDEIPSLWIFSHVPCTTVALYSALTSAWWPWVVDLCFGLFSYCVLVVFVNLWCMEAGSSYRIDSCYTEGGGVKRCALLVRGSRVRLVSLF